MQSIINEKNKIIDLVINMKLSYLDKLALSEIFDSVRSIEEKHINGIMIETGCALGGSSIVIASAKDNKRQLYLYDTFGMIPPPSQKDGDDIIKRYDVIKSGESKGISGDKYYGYQRNLKFKVKRNFKRLNLPVNKNNIHLISGLYKDTLKIEKNEKIAFAHIDCDWYESVLFSLKKIVPHLSVGAVLIIDDYYSWSGSKKAVDEYFNNKKGYSFTKKSRLHIKYDKK